MMTQARLIELLEDNSSLLDQYSVKSISVFGPIAKEKPNEGSDVDLLVEFTKNAKIGLFEFVGLKDALSDFPGVRVDLVTSDALHPAMKSSILQETVHVI